MQSSKATRVRRLPNALTSWKRLAKPLQFPRTVLLLLDFDGTLADIAPTLLTLLKLPQPEEMTGISLIPG